MDVSSPLNTETNYYIMVKGISYILDFTFNFSWHLTPNVTSNAPVQLCIQLHVCLMAWHRSLTLFQLPYICRIKHFLRPELLAWHSSLQQIKLAQEQISISISQYRAHPDIYSRVMRSKITQRNVLAENIYPIWRVQTSWARVVSLQFVFHYLRWPHGQQS